MGTCFAKHFKYLVHFCYFFWAVVLISNKAVSRKLLFGIYEAFFPVVHYLCRQASLHDVAQRESVAL